MLRTIPGFCVAGLILIGGCQKADIEASAITPKAETVSPTTLTVQKNDLVGSPANLAPVEIPADLEPNEVCKKFLQLLASGEISDAERLLSKRAAVVTRQAKLVLAAPAGKNSRFEFGTPQYANNKCQLAMVMCHISDDASDAASEEPAAISWMVRNEDEGWRITGLILLEDDEPSDLLSFENPLDVERIRELLGDEDTVRQASQPANVKR